MLKSIVLAVSFFFIGVSGDCHDSSSWYKTGEDWKTCEWVGEFKSARCNVKGTGDMYAFEMCGTACGSCDEECIDDPDWHKNGEPEKDCAWASRFTKRCTTIGADMRRGYEACRYACRTCDFDTTGESSSTAWTVTYRGARESCRAEVGAAISHCPDAFPEFETAVEDNPTCGFAAVGAGVGSLYTVMRLIDEGILEPSDVCLFEATERVGGRTYSLRYSDLNSKGSLVVDAGAYRTWPRFTPVTHAVITEYLGINVTCYDADEDPCERFIIVDGETGHNLGFTHYLVSTFYYIISFFFFRLINLFFLGSYG